MQRNESRKEVLCLTRITKKRILELCRKDKLYQTPELNDVLYLHYQGFECIECLEDYTELKCLWLECNAISEIQGLSSQTKLKCLFLQSNLIRKIENLEFCKELDTLNLSQNHIRKIENCGFEVLPVLNTLNLASNYLKDCEGLKELENCKNLSVLDLSNNRIDDILVVKIFSQMQELKVLVLQGNPVVSKIPQYRKTLILECKKLTYLDSRPVFPKDRACAEAWKRGGYQEERKENDRWSRKERKKMRDSVNATIHLRNKHRKLADQIALIPSSDSEDDRKEQKRNVRRRVDSEASMDSTWDEVTENKSDRSLIPNNIKKSDSEQSTESGNDEETIDTMINVKENIEIIEHKKIGEGEEIQEMSQNIEKELDLEDTTWGDVTDNKSDRSSISHNSIKSEAEKSTEGGNDDITIDYMIDGKEDIGIIEEQQIGEEEKVQEILQKETNTVTNPEHNDVDQQENCKIIMKAVEEITKTEDSSVSLFKEHKENLDSTEEDTEDNYEPLKELSETMNLFAQEVIYDQASRAIETRTIKPTSNLTSEQEYLKVNNHLRSDFEELNTNMSNFVDQLEREQVERQEVIKVLFCKEMAAAESSCESSENENIESVEKLKLDRMIDQWDKVTKIKKDNIIKIETEIKEIEADRDGKTSENTHKGSTASFEYIPMDISPLTRKSNEALISLERESKKLKQLLLKLENSFKDVNSEEEFQREDTNCEGQTENEKFYLTGKGNGGNHLQDRNDKMFDKNYAKDLIETRRDTFYSNSYIQEEKIPEKSTKTDGENPKQIVKQILEEILQSSDMINTQQKSYKFPQYLTDSNEESDLPSPKAVSRSMPDVINSFNHFFNEIDINKRTKDTCSLEKSLTLKDLSKQSNLKTFNTNTWQSLDEQLEEIRKNQHKEVRRVVDRVYAQKDRYNDTLELVDGKLMVRNQDTKKLQELSQSPQYKSSDSEEDYDTAQSDDECTNIKENLRKEQFKQRSFKPTARKSREDLIIKALFANKSNRSNDDYSDESTDEFYSLDCQDKPNLYNIDKEFLNKLTFDFPNLTEIDENHIVQCARSYEELKHYLTLNKEEESCLNKQEQEILDNMMKNKHVKINENPTTLSEYLQNNSNLSQQEQLWLNKITLKAEEATSQKIVQQQYQENTCNDKDELENSSEKKMTKTFLRDILEKKESDEYLNGKMSEDSISTVERTSEEEKNEIEINIDFERGTGDTKISGCGDELENSKGKLKLNEETDVLTTECTSDEINVEESTKTFADVEILECNLEIIGDNDQIVDTITVNAELHF